MRPGGGFGAGRSQDGPGQWKDPRRGCADRRDADGIRNASDAAQTKDPRRGIGAHGEELARLHLESHGYEILQQNFRSRYGEIDIIARRGAIITFVEVKTRQGYSHGRPFEAVSPRKQNQIRRMAEMWVAANAGIREVRRCEFRFDVISVRPERAEKGGGLDNQNESGGPDIDHMKDAFR